MERNTSAKDGSYYAGFLTPTASDGIRMSAFSVECLKKARIRKDTGENRFNPNFLEMYCSVIGRKPTEEELTRIMGYPTGYFSDTLAKLSEIASTQELRKLLSKP